MNETIKSRLTRAFLSAVRNERGIHSSLQTEPEEFINLLLEVTNSRPVVKFRYDRNLAPASKAPEYKTQGAAGVDLHFAGSEAVYLKPGSRVLLDTALYVEIPPGFEGQIRPRSGLALNEGITVLNSPGTIDSDFRGEVRVLLLNTSNDSVYISSGERIAQLVITRVAQASFMEVDELSPSERAQGGWGHTGKR